MDDVVNVIVSQLGWQGAFFVALAGYLVKKELSWQKERQRKDASWEQERKEWIERLIHKTDTEALKKENESLKAQVSMLKEQITAIKKRRWIFGS